MCRKKSQMTTRKIFPSVREPGSRCVHKSCRQPTILSPNLHKSCGQPYEISCVVTFLLLFRHDKIPDKKQWKLVKVHLSLQFEEKTVPQGEKVTVVRTT